MQQQQAIAALILAGGRGERLGGAIKSELTVGGVRLLDRVAARLDGCTPLLVAHGRMDPALLRLQPGMRPVPDLDSDYAGPLAGVAGGIAWLKSQPAPLPDLLVTVAVDTPFLPEDFIARLVESIGDAAACIAAYGGQAYPTNAIWRLAHFRDLPARVLAGTSPRSLKTLSASAGGVTVHWPESEAGDPFANANTPDELIALEAKALSGL